MTPAPPALVVQPRQPTRTNRLLRLAAAASVVAVIAGLAAITIRQQDRIADLQAHNRAIMEVITAPDAQLKVAQSAGISASMVSSSDRDAAVFVSSGLPQLPQGRTYQLWLLGQQPARPAGLLDGSSSAPVLLELDGAQAISLNTEPMGGSDEPTSNPVLTATLS